MSKEKSTKDDDNQSNVDSTKNNVNSEKKPKKEDLELEEMELIDMLLQGVDDLLPDQTEVKSPKKKPPKIPTTKPPRHPKTKKTPPKVKKKCIKELPKEGEKKQKILLKKPYVRRMSTKTRGREDGRLFGFELYKTDDVPLFLEDMCNYIVSNLDKCQFIFRVTGNKAKILQVQGLLDEGKEVNLEEIDMPVISQLIKLYFREYPGKVFSPLVENCLLFYKYEEQLEIEIKKFFDLIPISFLEVINVLLNCLYEIQKERNQELTKMDAKSLSTCIGPSIFKEGEALVNPCNDMLENMIKNYNIYFPEGLNALRERTVSAKKKTLIKKMKGKAIEYTRTVEQKLNQKEFSHFKEELRSLKRKTKQFDVLARDLFTIFGHKNKDLIYGFQLFLPSADKKRENFQIAVDSLMRSVEMSTQKYLTEVEKYLKGKDFADFKLFARMISNNKPTEGYFKGLAKELMKFFYDVNPTLMYGFQTYIVEKMRIKFTQVIDKVKKEEDKKRKKVSNKMKKEEKRQQKELEKKHKKQLKREEEIRKQKEKIRKKLQIKSAKLEKKKKIETEKRKKEIENIRKKLKEDRMKGYKKIIDNIKSKNFDPKKSTKKLEGLIESIDNFDINEYIKGLNLLHWATYYNRVSIVEYFLNDPDVIVNSITIDYPEDVGYRKFSSLMIASYRGFKKIVKLLLDFEGIDIKVTNDKNKNAEQISKNNPIKLVLKEMRLRQEDVEKSFFEKVEFLKKNYYDCNFLVKNEKIVSIEFFLNQCVYLKEKLNEDKEIEIKKHDRYTVEKVLEFLFGIEPKIKKSKLYGVYKLAKKWNLLNLCYLIVKKIQEKINFKDLLNILNIYMNIEGDFNGSVFEIAILKKIKKKFDFNIKEPRKIKLAKSRLNEKIIEKLEYLKNASDAIELRSRIVDHEDFIDLKRRDSSTRELLNQHILELQKSKIELNLKILSNDYDKGGESIQWVDGFDVNRIVLILSSEYFFNLFKQKEGILHLEKIRVEDFNFQDLNNFFSFTASNILPEQLEDLLKIYVMVDKFQRRTVEKEIKRTIEKLDDGFLISEIFKYWKVFGMMDDNGKGSLRTVFKKKIKERPLYFNQLVKESISFGEKIEKLKKELNSLRNEEKK